MRGRFQPLISWSGFCVAACEEVRGVAEDEPAGCLWHRRLPHAYPISLYLDRPLREADELLFY
jgi:hypothetical protein